MLHQEREPTIDGADRATFEITRAERDAELARASHRLREARRLARPLPVPVALRFSRDAARRPRELTAAEIFTF